MKMTSRKGRMFPGQQANFFIAFILLLLGTFATQAAAANPLIHNSANLGTKYWPANGWGVAGGQYGEFTCTTCHNSTTNNIKRVVESIPETIGPNVVKTVVFNNMTGFGDDSVSHAISVRICEVCHTQTLAHQYNTANAPQLNDLTHENGDCTVCHEHSAGFKATSHFVPLWGTTAGHIGCASGIGCHANSNPAAPYPTTGDPAPAPDCRACHTKADPTVATNGCGSCHGVANGTGEPSGTVYPDTAGSHPAHTPLALCTECHNVGGTGGNADHGKGNRGANPAVVNLAASYTWNGTTCSTASCHADVYSTGTVLTPQWGAAAGCEACHTTTIGVNGPATGSHIIHAGQACTNCHAAGTSATTAPSSGHTDGDIDTAVGGYPTNITKHAAGSGYAAASCSTITCHGGATMTWGANTTDTSCTKCHGKGTLLANYSTTNAWQAAPGYATTGTDINGQTGTYTNGVSSDTQVGAHDAHLRMINGYSDRQLLCTDCHAIPGSANHANGSTDYTWSNLAKNIGTVGTVSTRGALTPGYATSTCSTNYCHGGVLNGGSDTTPVWNDTTYLTAYAKNDTTCGKCHGSPPTSGASLGYDHNGVTIATGCTSCHGHEGNGPNHIDGNLQATGGACNACHSYDTVGGVWGSGTRLDGAVAEGWGAHAQHIDHLKTLRGVTLNASTDTYGSAAFDAVCGVCHDRLPANHTLDNSSARMINISTAYQTGANPPAYLGVSGTPSSVNPKTCSNISCHFGNSPQWQ